MGARKACLFLKGMLFVAVFKDILVHSYPMFILGLESTLKIFLISVSIGFLIGLFIALSKLSSLKPVSWLASGYVNIIRGTPFILQLLFIYTVNGFLFSYLNETWPTIFADVDTRELSGIITVALNAGGYFSEIIRGGILSIDKGQGEAARSLGFSKKQTMWLVVLPQAIRQLFPSLANQAIISLKDTSLLTTIGIGELMYQGSLVYSANFQILPTLTILGIIYFIIIYLLTQLFNLIERKVRIP